MGRKAGIEVGQIIDAAAGIADADGLDAVTLARVAAGLGIKSPSLYNHIDGLEHLLRLLSRRGALALGDHLRAAVAGASGEEAVRALCDGYRLFAKAQPGLYAASQRAVTAAEDPEVAGAMGSVVDVVAGPLRELGLDDEGLTDTVRAIRALLHGFVQLETQSGFGLDRSVEQSFERAVDLVVSGLQTR